MRYIVYKGKKYNRFVLNFKMDEPFYEILNRINSLEIPNSPHDDEHTRYAILELINNSIRAQRELGTDTLIKVGFKVRDDDLSISIVDQGGGFDINLLPYDIKSEAEKINTENMDFQQYREKNHYKKFGMGLVFVRKLFSDFELNFYDENGKDIPYHPDRVIGTRITIGFQWNDD